MSNQERAAAIDELQEFIAVSSDAREVRKALAVKLVYQDYLYKEIQKILDVSVGSITGWKQAYEQDGIAGLRLNYKGRKSYLSTEQRAEILSWLQTKECWELGELEYKLAFEYDVTYESKQSYYDLFNAAGISWKKTTSLNPKADPDAVAAKKNKMNYPAASGRGIKIKRDSIAQLGVTSNNHSPDFAHIWRSSVRFHVYPQCWQNTRHSRTLRPITVASPADTV
jgi:putative transposase